MIPMEFIVRQSPTDIFLLNYDTFHFIDYVHKRG